MEAQYIHVHPTDTCSVMYWQFNSVVPFNIYFLFVVFKVFFVLVVCGLTINKNNWVTMLAKLVVRATSSTIAFSLLLVSVESGIFPDTQGHISWKTTLCTVVNSNQGQ